MNKVIYSCSASELSGTIDSVIEEFKRIKKQFTKEGYQNIYIDFETEYGYYDDSWVEMKVYADDKLTNGRYIKNETSISN